LKDVVENAAQRWFWDCLRQAKQGDAQNQMLVRPPPPQKTDGRRVRLLVMPQGIVTGRLASQQRKNEVDVMQFYFEKLGFNVVGRERRAWPPRG
jgi:hypothetical protein